jgi:hypothetical protein
MPDKSKINQNEPTISVGQASYEVGITRLPVEEWSDITYEELFERGSRSRSPKFLQWQLTHQIYQIIVYDGIDMMFRTAQISLFDTTAVRELFPFTGNEIITVKYKNLYAPSSTGSGAVEKIFHFSIVNIKEVELPNERRQGARAIVMNLVEAPAYQVFTNNVIYKSYPIDGGGPGRYPRRSMLLSDLITDTLKSSPIINNFYNIDVEESLKTEADKIDFYIPNWTMIKTLSYLRKFITSSGTFPYYVINIDPPKGEGLRPTIRVRSIYSYMSSQNYHFFTNTQAHLLYRSTANKQRKGRDYTKDENEDNRYEIMNTMLSYGFDYFDRTLSTFGGLSGETFATFDYLADNSYIGFDFNTLKNNYWGLGNFSLHEMNYGNQWSKFRPHPFNDPKKLWAMKRNEFAQNAIKSGIFCHVSSYLNNYRRVGNMCDVVFDNNLSDSRVDMMMSGHWLIYEQVDKIAPNEARSHVTLIKDGLETVQSEVYKSRLTKINNLNPVNRNAGIDSVGGAGGAIPKDNLNRSTDFSSNSATCPANIEINKWQKGLSRGN